MPIRQRRQAIFDNVAFRVIHQYRRIPAPINARDNGPIIGQEFSEKGDEKQHAENDQGPITALIGAEICQPALREWRNRHRRASKSMRGSTSV